MSLCQWHCTLRSLHMIMHVSCCQQCQRPAKSQHKSFKGKQLVTHTYLSHTCTSLSHTQIHMCTHTLTYIHTYTHTLTVKRNCVTIVIHISQIHCRQLKALLELHRERKQRIKLGLASANIPSHKSLIWGTTVAVSGSKTSPMGLWCVLSNLYPLDVF